MASRHKHARQGGGFVLFDVHYADGTRSSNRRVPSEAVAGLDGDDLARAFIEAQEKDIARSSGRPPRTVASVVRSDAKPKTPRSR